MTFDFTPENTTTEETPDGGVVITFGAEPLPDVGDIGHGENLAEYMTDSELQAIASELIEAFETDKRSRSEWEMAYVKGLDLLGLKIEERSQPWPGASGVYHPILTEAVIRFQSSAIMEIFPASGPVKTDIIGKNDTERTKQAQRVEEEMNYILTETMTEYRAETEQLLFRLPLSGSVFRKVYFDDGMQRPAAIFVPAEDFYVSYGASDLKSCERYTHSMRKTPNEIRKLQVSGFYRDIPLPAPAPDYSKIKEKHDKLEGSRAPGVEYDERHQILELHVDLDLPDPFNDPDGIARPYVVAIDKGSSIVLSIRKNWREGDEAFTKREYFIHYTYFPGLGFYGFGLMHIMGGLAKSATSIMRNLIDAGTLSNLPAGFKARGLRIKGEQSPLMPGEFRDVDVPGGALKDAISFVPSKEPSAVLYSLLGNVVEEGRRVGSMADMNISDMSSQAPVGTTLALMERNMKVMSAVHGRLHASLRKEFRLIADTVVEYMDPNYQYEVEGNYSRKQDFTDRVNIIPVSDPNATTMAQRVVQYQAALTMSQTAPQLYDLALLHRQMLGVLSIPDFDKIVKLPDEFKPMDPVSENMAILKQEPVKAFMYQDHEAHIATHMAAAQDPKLLQIIGQSPGATAIQAAMSAHVTEHVAMQYRREIEMQLGAPLPDPDAPMPEDVEYQLSKIIADAAQKVLGKDQAEMAAQKAQQAQQDPIIQMQQRELAVKEADLARKAQKDKADMTVAMSDIQMKGEQIASQERQTGARLGVQITADHQKDATEATKTAIKTGLEISQGLADHSLDQERLEVERDRNEVAREQIAANKQSNKSNE